MRAAIPALDTRGDMQPNIALALGLRRAGDRVTLATHPCMRARVGSYGLPFAPTGRNRDIEGGPAHIRANALPWMVGFMRLMRFSFAMVEQWHAEVPETCRNGEAGRVEPRCRGGVR